jgi:hypothetical protein
MTIYFVDSSALVKRYISEIGSGWVLNLFDRTVRSADFSPQAKSGLKSNVTAQVSIARPVYLLR